MLVVGGVIVVAPVPGHRDGVARQPALGTQAAALSFSSPFSIPYLLDTLVPQLEAGADGDPTTEVPVGA